MYKENRINPRVKAEYPAEIIDQNGEKLAVLILDLSAKGVMVEASHHCFEAILKNNRNLNINSPVEVDLHFGLPKSKKTKTDIQAHCRAIYVRRQAQDKYHIGFNFLQLSSESAECIARFVAGRFSQQNN